MNSSIEQHHSTQLERFMASEKVQQGGRDKYGQDLILEQLKDRFGVLFEDCRVVTDDVWWAPLAFSAFLAELLKDIAVGILIGIQVGAAVPVRSNTSLVLNSAILGCKAGYALYLTAVRPQARGECDCVRTSYCE